MIEARGERKANIKYIGCYEVESTDYGRYVSVSVRHCVWLDLIISCENERLNTILVLRTNRLEEAHARFRNLRRLLANHGPVRVIPSFTDTCVERGLEIIYFVPNIADALILPFHNCSILNVKDGTLIK